MADDPKNPASDAELLAAVARREREALSALYDRHASVLFATALRILGERNEAEDAVQEALIQIWQKASTYSGHAGTPFAWMITVLRNKAIERLRVSKRRAHLADEVASRTETTVDPPAANEAAEREGGRLARTLVEALPGEQRQAIAMAFFDGLTQQEIAEALSQPLGTIKARIRRGLMKLRESLEHRV